MTVIDLTAAWFHVHLQLSDAALLGLWPLPPRLLARAGKPPSRPACP